MTSVTDVHDYVYTLAAQTSTLSVPITDAFDASFSLEAGLNDSQDSQDPPCQFDFFSTLMASEPANPDFDGSFDVDISAWNEAVFGQSPSQESTSSTSTSSWESTSKEGTSMETGTGMGIDMQLQFPIVSVDAIEDGTGAPTEDEFLRVVVEAAQSSPKTVSPISCIILSSDRALIQLVHVGRFCGGQSSAQDGFELFWDAGEFDL